MSKNKITSEMKYAMMVILLDENEMGEVLRIEIEPQENNLYKYRGAIYTKGEMIATLVPKVQEWHGAENVDVYNCCTQISSLLDQRLEQD